MKPDLKIWALVAACTHAMLSAPSESWFDTSVVLKESSITQGHEGLTDTQLRWRIRKLKADLKKMSFLCCCRKNRLQVRLEKMEEEWETRLALLKTMHLNKVQKPEGD